MTADLAQRVRAARTSADREVGRAQEVAWAGKRAEADVAALAAAIEQHERVARMLTTIGEERQESMQRQIEETVTRGLQVIFGGELSFHVVQSVRANAAQVDFVLRSEYPCAECGGNPAAYPAPGCPRCEQTGKQAVDTPVMEARGGGMVAVVGFVLRLVLLLRTPGTRPVLFLDESFAHVSRDYEPRVAEFLREVSETAGVQIILITHSDAFDDAADQRYRLELQDGVTVEHEEG